MQTGNPSTRAKVPMSRRFPAPWIVEPIPGGFKVLDANGQALAYVYAREDEDAAHIAKVLTMDEARRIAATSQSCRVALRVGRGLIGPFYA